MVGLSSVELSCLVGLSSDCFPSKVMFMSWLANIVYVTNFSSSVLKVGFKMVWTIKSCTGHHLLFIFFFHAVL